MAKLVAFVIVVAAVAVFAATVASAGNPSATGTGQPSQSCQAEPTGPSGIVSTTNGFARIAVNVYAGSAPQNSTNPKSVSQYDVACYQVSTH
jgi:hypothetical protein